MTYRIGIFCKISGFGNSKLFLSIKTSKPPAAVKFPFVLPDVFIYKVCSLQFQIIMHAVAAHPITVHKFGQFMHWNKVLTLDTVAFLCFPALWVAGFCTDDHSVFEHDFSPILCSTKSLINFFTLGRTLVLYMTFGLRS